MSRALGVSSTKDTRNVCGQKDFGPVLYEELSSLRRHSVILFHSERYPNKISEWTLRAEPKRETKYYDKGRREVPPVSFGAAARILVRHGRFLVHPDYPRSEHICGFAENPMSDRAYVLARRAMVRARSEISEDGMLPKQKITEVIMRFRTEEKYAHLSEEEIKRMEDIARGNASNRGWADSSVARSFYLNRRKLTSTKYYKPRKVLDCPIVGCDFVTTAPGMIDVHISEFHKTADGFPEPKNSTFSAFNDFCPKEENEEEWIDCETTDDKEVPTEVVDEEESCRPPTGSPRGELREEETFGRAVESSPGNDFPEEDEEIIEPVTSEPSRITSPEHESPTRTVADTLGDGVPRDKKSLDEPYFGPVTFKGLSSQGTSMFVLYHSKRFPKKISEWSQKINTRSRSHLLFCILCQRVKEKAERAKRSCGALARILVANNRFLHDPDYPKTPHICDFENNPLADAEVVLLRRPLGKKASENSEIGTRKRFAANLRDTLYAKQRILDGSGSLYGEVQPKERTELVVSAPQPSTSRTGVTFIEDFIVEEDDDVCVEVHDSETEAVFCGDGRNVLENLKGSFPECSTADREKESVAGYPPVHTSSNSESVAAADTALQETAGNSDNDAKVVIADGKGDIRNLQADLKAHLKKLADKVDFMASAELYKGIDMLSTMLGSLPSRGNCSSSQQ